MPGSEAWEIKEGGEGDDDANLFVFLRKLLFGKWVFIKRRFAVMGVRFGSISCSEKEKKKKSS